MPRMLCCHKDCPAVEDVNIPLGTLYPTWYCREHRGRTDFAPRRDLEEVEPLTDISKLPRAIQKALDRVAECAVAEGLPVDPAIQRTYTEYLNCDLDNDEAILEVMLNLSFRLTHRAKGLLQKLTTKQPMAISMNLDAALRKLVKARESADA